MEKNLYDLIEAYLDGTLPDEQQREVAARMASDKDFRQEVELHRDLQESYADPERWQLRTALLKAMEEPLQPVAPPEPQPNLTADRQDTPRPQNLNTSNVSSIRWKWWIVLPIALVLGLGTWYYTRPHTPMPTDKPTFESPVTPSATKEQEATKEETKPPLQKSTENRPIAMADPANFQENRTMEGLIRMRDGGDLSVEITRPKIGERFNPKPSGKTGLRFSGSIEGLSDPTAFKVHLLIFHNKNANTPLLTQPLSLSADAQGKATFDLAPQVNFPQGLYYFFLEDEDSARLAAGKFFIGSLLRK